MDIMGIMKKAQEMQSKLAETQEELGRIEVEGQSGGGMVKVTLSGKGDMKAVKLDPSLMKADEVEMAEDLTAIGIEDSVDGDGRCGRLQKVHRLLRRDIEGLPVE